MTHFVETRGLYRGNMTFPTYKVNTYVDASYPAIYGGGDGDACGGAIYDDNHDTHGDNIHYDNTHDDTHDDVCARAAQKH